MIIIMVLYWGNVGHIGAIIPIGAILARPRTGVTKATQRPRSDLERDASLQLAV